MRRGLGSASDFQGCPETTDHRHSELKRAFKNMLQRRKLRPRILQVVLNCHLDPLSSIPHSVSHYGCSGLVILGSGTGGKGFVLEPSRNILHLPESAVPRSATLYQPWIGHLAYCPEELKLKMVPRTKLDSAKN